MYETKREGQGLGPRRPHGSGSLALLQNRVDPAHARARGLLLLDPELAEQARALDVGTAADFLGEVAYRVDLDRLLVLLAEEGPGPEALASSSFIIVHRDREVAARSAR